MVETDRWNIIAPDFYDLCNWFYNGSIYMQSINGSLVTLIPKKGLEIWGDDKLLEHYCS
jgi:hypothetical protein